MKIILRAAMATWSLSSISPAIAGEVNAACPNTFLTSLPGVIAPAPQQVTTIATAQSFVTEHQ